MNGHTRPAKAERRAQQDEERSKKKIQRMSEKAALLILARHGETDWNLEPRLQGQLVPGPPLNELGFQQAHALAAYLKGENISAIYSSDLQRTMETAELISKYTEVQPVVARSDLRERHLGDLQGLNYTEAKTKQPEAWACLHAHDSSVGIPGGGESLQQLDARMATALEDIAAKHPGQRVVVVSHGGALHGAHRRATGHDVGGNMSNCSITRIQVEGSSWALLSWNEDGHLKGVGVHEWGSGGGSRAG